jgi:hypothetical protein
LYAIKNEHAISDLIYEFEDIRSRMDGKLPDGFIVIGHDPGDSLFLLGTRGEHAGQVWYWDTARLMKTTSPSENTYWLADSFTNYFGRDPTNYLKVIDSFLSPTPWLPSGSPPTGRTRSWGSSTPTPTRSTATVAYGFPSLRG